jgi:hypothetical protein
MWWPAMRSPSSVSIGSLPVTRARLSATQASGKQGRAGQADGGAVAALGGDEAQHLGQGDVLAAQDMPLARGAMVERRDHAGRAIGSTWTRLSPVST